MSAYKNENQNGKVSDSLTMPFGAFAATGLQKFIIYLVRKNPLLRSAVRTRANRLIQKIRPGAIDYELYGWIFRFFPAENTGDRKALLTPDGFDQRECELIAEHLEQGGLFLDIGSNIGIYSFYVAAHRKDAQIIAFEPTPRVFAKLSFNLQANGLTDRVSAMNLALSDKKGEMQFNTSLESLVLGEPDTVVRTDTLLNVLTEKGVLTVSALKIDVEGAEDLILNPFFAEAPKSLWPQMIVIEHIFPEHWDWNCTEFLEKNGYVRAWRGKMNTVYYLEQD